MLFLLIHVNKLGPEKGMQIVKPILITSRYKQTVNLLNLHHALQIFARTLLE